MFQRLSWTRVLGFCAGGVGSASLSSFCGGHILRCTSLLVTRECTRPRMNKTGAAKCGERQKGGRKPPLLDNSNCIVRLSAAAYGATNPRVPALTMTPESRQPTTPCDSIIYCNSFLFCSHSDNLPCANSLRSRIADVQPHPFQQCLRFSRGGRMGTAP